jgi:hypothetical protein
MMSEPYHPTMPLQGSNGYERIGNARAEFHTQMEKDIFMCALVGAMSNHLDANTLGFCIASAKESTRTMARTEKSA